MLFHLLFLTTLVISIQGSCLITDDPKIQNITLDEVDNYQPQFSEPVFGNQSICLLNNILERTLEIYFPIFKTRTNSLYSYPQDVKIIPTPLIPSEGKVECMEIICPDKYHKDLICWECVEHLEIPFIFHIPPSTSSSYLPPEKLSHIFVQLSPLNNITAQASHIITGRVSTCRSTSVEQEYSIGMEIIIGVSFTLFMIGCLLGLVFGLICCRNCF